MKEKDLEDFLFDNPSAVSFFSIAPWGFQNTLKVNFWIGRQVNVASGIIDLLGVTAQNDFVVVEVKLGCVKPEALSQVLRYAADIDDCLNGIVYATPKPNQYHQSLQDNATYEIRVHKLIIGESFKQKTLLEANSLGVACVEIDSSHWTLTSCLLPLDAYNAGLEINHQASKLIEPYLEKMFEGKDRFRAECSNMEAEVSDILDYMEF